jgi:DNA-binding response OmpR family regulator
MSDDEQKEGTEAGAHILVIDDEEVIHQSLSRILGRQGHRVDGALRAQEGLDKLTAGSYDMIITDLMMPGMDGLELLHKLQEMQLSLPVLMITGYPTIRTAMQAMRLGAVDYLAKPFRRQELLGPVNRMLRRSAREEAAAAPVEPRASPDGYRPKVGDRFVLHDHAWAVYQQDGTLQVGIEASFLDSIGAIGAADLPGEAELVEQGHVGIRLTTDSGEVHGVFMPLSGQVLEVNKPAEANPSGITADLWLVQIVPSHLDGEISYLHSDTHSGRADS